MAQITSSVWTSSVNYGSLLHTALRCRTSPCPSCPTSPCLGLLPGKSTLDLRPLHPTVPTSMTSLLQKVDSLLTHVSGTPPSALLVALPVHRRRVPPSVLQSSLPRPTNTYRNSWCLPGTRSRFHVTPGNLYVYGPLRCHPSQFPWTSFVPRSGWNVVSSTTGKEEEQDPPTRRL